MLRIRTLGASEITVADARVGAEQPLAFALLLLVAVAGGGTLSRRELATVLWPEVEASDRNHRLRSLLHRLRRMGAPLACTGATVSLTAATVDFREFVPPPASLDVVRACVSAIGPVLPDVTSPNAVLADRLDDIRDVIVGTITHWLAAARELARRAGDWPLVERLARAAEQIDPTDDDAVLERAEAACLTGKPRAALALLDELDARADADEKVCLAAAALRRRITALASVRDGDPPLVGRDEIMRRLCSAVARAGRGSGGGILLWGPAGIGKTRLLRELDSLCLTNGARVVRVDARPVHGLRPFTLIIEIAGRLLDEPGAAGCEPDSYGLLLGAGCRARPNDLGTGAANAIPERAFCDAFVELLAAVSDESPTVVAIDDIHLADPALWRVLGGLTRWSADQRALWIFTYRALRDAELASLPDAAAISRVAVGCLDATAATALVCALTSSRNTDREELLAVAGGHPLLLHALSRAGGSVPADVECVVEDSLARLPADELRVLRLVATLGGATPRALAELGFLSRAELGVALADLERAGMIREDDGTLCVHRVWAAAALATLPRSERLTFELDAPLARR
jgi:hypothetical protein